MSAEIFKVDRKSPAFRAGVRPGDTLLSINGHNIIDVLDYKFYSYDSKTLLKLQDRELIIKKDEGEDLGLTFESYLIDKAKRCANNCIFCFIDQLPEGMRKTLYFKDDDARMSFLMGNYISLTNLSSDDLDRIIKMRISPVNISVQVTDPEVRRMMLRNPRAGECMEILERFAEADLMLNCQIVVCPGINDGEVLKRTLSDLIRLSPAVNSISVVPVGITRHRDGLYPLTPVNESMANEIIEISNEIGEQCLVEHYTRIVYASDELYIKAKKPIPDCSYYEDFPQLENGVGLIAMLMDEFMDALKNIKGRVKANDFTLATGISASPFISKLVDELRKKCNNVFTGNVIPIENRFFGNTVNVAGLITGSDLLEGLRSRDLHGKLLIPEVMLRHGENVFLDDVTVFQVESELGVTVTSVKNDGEELLKAMLS